MKQNHRSLWLVAALAVAGVFDVAGVATAAVPTVDDCPEADYVDRTDVAADRTLSPPR